VCLGIRGMVKAELEISGPTTDIHAGAVSGVAPNPAVELVRVLGRLHTPDGKVAIPGFYDDVFEASEQERRELTTLTADESAWVARTGTRAVIGEAGRSLGERLYLRPAAEVESLLSGDPVGSERGVIPAGATASIQLSLVPDQDPAKASEQLQAWLADEVSNDFGWTLTIGEVQRQLPYSTPPDHPAVAVLIDAMTEAWDRPAATMRNAGTGPAALLAETIGAPVLFFGTGLPEDHWHGPDESVHVGVLLKGAATIALFWTRLSSPLSRPPR
jgi:acetylornithine deacetylase/succinyl-diaminopimelate desuccinylase-like protein